MFSFSDHELVFIFGLLGNIVSFLVFLAPLPTFYTIYKNKSSEGFQSIPYIVALLSAMLLLYYGFLKSHAILIITINCIGCAIEVTYLILYFIYAPRKQKISTLLMLAFFDVGGFSLTMIITIFVFKGINRVHAVGWVCAIFNIAVFAAPLSIMRRVIKTKSVEFMPFSLSFFLTLCATMWFFYGFFSKDYFIMLPNVLGFLFGVAQMVLYMMYKDANKKNSSESNCEWKATVDDHCSAFKAKDINSQPQTSHLQFNV
ncbi:bidirectional sugar transporter NEC1-like [Prosopis cineraria]|uniref:bidirectional sugar transporter NEC1-like n=1 Tax=Prosopis cineraria TaxID=364024 RepID=UPI00240FD3B9|nr:bidirectional sugar transporter NEC1-like [Prosopis cineraria]